MRRVYTKNSKTKEKALKQLRDTKAKLTADHPELMQTMRKHAEKMHEPPKPKPPSSQSTFEDTLRQIAPVDKSTGDELPIDQDKNITTILKFMEVKEDGNSGVNKALKALLLKHIKSKNSLH